MRLYIHFVPLLLTVALQGSHSAYSAPSEDGGQQVRAVNIDSSPIDRSAPAGVTSYADVLDRVRPAVVSVFSTRIVSQPRLPFGDDPLFRRFFGIPEGEPGEQARQGLGSGVVVDEEGYVLTNNHVIEGADEVKVALPDGRDFTATVVGADPKTDVAILKIEAEELPVATLTDSEKLRVGDIVFALGNPLGVGQTVTMGIISATGRTGMGILGEEGYEDFIQTDAAINSGNSGGPLVDAHGRVVGINTAILSRTGGNIGIGFAIPANLVSSVMESLIETGTVARGYMGVHLQPLSPELADEFDIPDGQGALVSNVVEGSPADTAGMQRGDVIVNVNGQRVKDARSLRLAVSQMQPGSKPVIELIRDGERHSLEVELGQLDEDVAIAQQGQLGFLEGVSVSEITPELRDRFNLPADLKGLVVTEVNQQSPYADQIPVGAVIMEINRRPLENMATASELLQPGRNLLLIHYRGAFHFITILMEQ